MKGFCAKFAQVWVAVLLIAAVAGPSAADVASYDTPRRDAQTQIQPAPIAGGLFDRLFSPSSRVSAMRPHPAVVRVIVPERNGASFGSGTLVDVRDQHGLVVTNWHVVCDLTGTPTVVFPDGFRSAAQVVKVDREWDLAALAIWKPNVSPVPLAERAPRPGEKLSIAGYGGGPYRQVSGSCTQYVAPGMNQPMEMVELAASARQGDSGGPIFNAQGELAGVLFGEGHGRTAGSYCGRVRTFLSTVLPEAGPPTRAAGIELAAKTGHAATSTSADTTYATASSSRASEVLEPQATVEAGSDDERFARPAPLQSLPTRHEIGAGAAGGGDAPTESQGEPFDFCYFAGQTRLEQLKSILAVVGALALSIRVCRMLGRRRQMGNVG